MTTYTIWASQRYLSTYRICANASSTVVNGNGDVLSQSRGLHFGLSFHLHPYFVYASSDGTVESVHMRRLARAFAAR